MSKNVIYQEEGELTLVSPEFRVEPRIEPNFYEVVTKDMGMFSKREVKIDKSISLPESAIDSYKKHFKSKVPYIKDYFSSESIKIHKSLGVKHKLGVLLYGKQGTGKTTICYSLAQHLIDENAAIVFTVNSLNDMMFAMEFCKQADPKEKFLKIFIFDECEDDMHQSESSFKRVLDSAISPNNTLFLFTTNYFEYVPETIHNRPSRVKWVMEIKGYSNEDEIYTILMELNEGLAENVKLSVADVKGVVPELKGKTIDEIKNVFVDTVLKINLKKVTGKKEMLEI
jgi:GTPase SAR1 family protein